VLLVPRTLYQNTPQSCTFTCPDGTPFTHTVPAGTFSALSQAAANAFALSRACNRAVDNRICIGSLSNSSACVGESISRSVSISPRNTPIVVTIASGSLPTGLELNYTDTSFTISGTPTAAGSYTFQIEVEDVEGNFMVKEFTMSVAEIANGSPLPAATSGTPYSVALTVDGPITGALTWSLRVGGTLPTGLSLSSSGVISGTPTDVSPFTYGFTIDVTDGA
jgi:hypothetical protein